MTLSPFDDDAHVCIGSDVLYFICPTLTCETINSTVHTYSTDATIRKNICLAGLNSYGLADLGLVWPYSTMLGTVASVDTVG